MDKNNNTGSCNIGDRNTGNWNTGNWNTGNWNTGYCNTGYNNTGNYNAGNYNVGNLNAGGLNIGNNNTGNKNIGHRNIGNRNIGDWNTGDLNTGYCNTISPKHTLVFNKLCTFEEWDNTIKPDWIYFDLDLDLPAWVEFSDLTIEQRKQYPEAEQLGGYLTGGIKKALSTEQKKELFQKSAIDAWNKTTQEDRELTFKLPNFDWDVFTEIFGITPDNKLNNNVDLSEMSTDDLMAELAKRIDK